MGGALARFLCIELRVSDFGWGLVVPIASVAYCKNETPRKPCDLRGAGRLLGLTRRWSLKVAPAANSGSRHVLYRVGQSKNTGSLARS